jgi:hypothetical protein
MSPWQIAIGNVDKFKETEGTKLKCEYCGDDMESPENVTNKKYCSTRCQRDARYLREHGHRPTYRREN